MYCWCGVHDMNALACPTPRPGHDVPYSTVCKACAFDELSLLHAHGRHQQSWPLSQLHLRVGTNGYCPLISAPDAKRNRQTDRCRHVRSPKVLECREEHGKDSRHTLATHCGPSAAGLSVATIVHRLHAISKRRPRTMLRRRHPPAKGDRRNGGRRQGGRAMEAGRRKSLGRVSSYQLRHISW